MNSKQTRKIVIDGLMIAIVFLTTYFTKFPGPIPQGYINLGDSAIIVAALLFGKRNASVAGAIGSALSDFSGGYLLFVPATFIIKGLEGFIIGLIAEKLGNTKVARLVAIVTGMVIMVLGYFIAETTILSLFDTSLGLGAAIAEFPGNIVQGVASAVIGYAVSYVLSKNKIYKMN